MQRINIMALAALAGAIPGFAANIYVGTNNNNAPSWTIAAGAGGSGPAFQASGISLTSNTTITGTPLAGANLAQWDGFWMATLHFTLPANALNPVLTFTGLGSDDRAVIRLNGNNVADNLVFGGGGAGVFNFGSGDQPFNFSGQTSFTVNGGFVLGGANTLVAFVNNTGSPDRSAPTRGFVNQTDGSDVAFDATVSFTQPAAVPEPGTYGLIAIGLAVLGRLRR